MKKKYLKILAVILWISFITMSGIVYYVNWHMPHGPYYPTGKIVCQNDDRGPCEEEYKEDMRGLNIPEWAKFIRRSEGQLLWLGLLFAAIIATVYSKEKDSNEQI